MIDFTKMIRNNFKKNNYIFNFLRFIYLLITRFNLFIKEANSNANKKYTRFESPIKKSYSDRQEFKSSEKESYYNNDKKTCITFSDYKESIKKPKTKDILREKGFEQVKVPGDGDCFYHAVRLHLDQKDQNNTIKNLRNRVANYIEEQLIKHNNQEFRNAILADYPNESVYLAKLRKGRNELWADNLQIVALMRVLGRPIYVIDNNGKCRYTGDINEERLIGKPIFVNYNGEDHYNGLQKIAKPHREKSMYLRK